MGESGSGTRVVKVRDTRFRKVRGMFEFTRRPGGAYAWTGYTIEVHGSKLAKGGHALRLTELREDLPLGEWEAAAKVALANLLLSEAEAAGETTSSRLRSPSSRLRSPEANDNRRRSLERLAQVSELYSAQVKAGVRDPSSAIAREFEVTPNAARVWVHRARQAGLLPPVAEAT